MKKKIVLFSVLILCLLPGYCFSADKYDEAAEVLKPYLPAMKIYLYVVENTQNSVELARAMNQLCDKMEELAPKIRRLSKKYPGLENEQRVPARHMQFRNELELLVQRFTQSYVRIIPHIGNQQVRKANGRMIGILASVGATWQP